MKYQGTSLSEVRKNTFAGLKPEMSKVWSGFAVSVVVRSTWTNVWIWWKISREPEEWWRPTQWSACPVLLRCQPPPEHYSCDWKSTTWTKHMNDRICWSPPPKPTKLKKSQIWLSTTAQSGHMINSVIHCQFSHPYCRWQTTKIITIMIRITVFIL